MIFNVHISIGKTSFPENHNNLLLLLITNFFENLYFQKMPYLMLFFNLIVITGKIILFYSI